MSTQQQESQTQITDPAVTENVDVNPFNADDQKPASDEGATETKPIEEGESDEASSLSLLGDADKPTDEPVADGENTEVEKVDEPTEPIEYDLKLSDNTQMDETVLAEVKEFAEANKLTPEAAQDVVDRVERAAIETLQKAHDAWTSEAEANRKALNADPDLGGDNLKETDMLATAALSRFDTDGEMMKFITDAKAEHNPIVVRFLKAIGKSMAPDTLHLGNSRGGTGGNSPQEIADQLFGHVKS